MEVIKKLVDIDPGDLSVVARVFGQRLDDSVSAVLILRVSERAAADATVSDTQDVPAWCNVLEGMSDEDLAEFNAILESPVRLAHAKP